MKYPQWYHRALNALISDPFTHAARQALAYALRAARRPQSLDCRQVTPANLRYKATTIGWPVKPRPNGRFN